MKIERFEDIRAWQEARALVKMVYDAVKADEVSKIISGFIQYLLGKGKSHLNEREKLNKLGKLNKPGELNKPGGGEELVVAGNLGGEVKWITREAQGSS